ncbi:MAG: protease HtpX [Halobacteriovoraceae bacterium]|nr:protease HtpX [Halobacteriovoraceae bacterium]
MFKRIGLFLLTNIAVIVMVSIVLNLLGVGGYYTPQGIDHTALLIFCGVWGMVGAFISLGMSKFMAKQFMGVQIVDNSPQYASLVNTVHQLAKQANLPKMPEVGIYNSPEVNAFATGPSKRNSLVAVSTGLLNGMSQDEVEGVLAHEVSHIANGDMVTMTLIQGVVNAFVMFFARIAAFAVSNFMRGDDEEGEGLGWFAHMAVIFVFEIIFGLLGSIVVAFFSRYREYRADSGAARLAGREKMIAALQRLKNQTYMDKRGESLATLKISNRKGGLAALISTHPSLDDRIKALQRVS